MSALFDRVRADFPRAQTAAYFDNASSHPISVHSAAALHRYVDWLTHELGEPWWPQWAQPRDQVKALFAQLINADANEIAFARSTLEAESNLINGMADHLAGGNVVTTDLSFNPCIYHYMVRQQQGLDVRVVKNRDWQIDMDAMERAIDGNTRWVSVALVSNVNGLVADVAALSQLAHAHGAYLYADIMQAAGAVPIDVQAMGIDFAACSTFKWLMGVKGFAFMYMREDLQGAVLTPSQPFGGVHLNYAPWVETPDADADDILFSPNTGAGAYEVSYPSYEGVGRGQYPGACQIPHRPLAGGTAGKGLPIDHAAGERKSHSRLYDPGPGCNHGQYKGRRCARGDALRQQAADFTLCVQ